MLHASDEEIPFGCLVVLLMLLIPWGLLVLFVLSVVLVLFVVFGLIGAIGVNVLIGRIRAIDGSI